MVVRANHLNHNPHFLDLVHLFRQINMEICPAATRDIIHSIVPADFFLFSFVFVFFEKLFLNLWSVSIAVEFLEKWSFSSRRVSSPEYIFLHGKIEIFSWKEDIER